MIFVVCRQVVHRKVSDYVSTKRVQKFHGLWCVPGTYTSDRQPCDKRGLTRTEFPTWPADTNAILSPFIVRITVSLIRNTRHYCSREKIGCDDGYNEHYIDFNKRFNEFRYRHSCFSSLRLIFSLSLSFFFFFNLVYLRKLYFSNIKYNDLQEIRSLQFNKIFRISL